MKKAFNTAFNFLFLFLFLTVADFSSSQDTLSAIENYEAGKVAQRTFDVEQAIEYFQAALAVNPNYFNARYELAYSYYLLGEYAQAEQFARHAQRLALNNVDLKILRARIATALANYQDALSQYQALLLDYPRDARIQIGIGELLIAQEQFTDAISTLENALKIDSDNYLVHLLLAAIYEYTGYPEKSNQFIEEALFNEPLNFYTQYNAAQHYLNRNMVPSARYHAEIAADLSPNNPAVLTLLAAIALQQKEFGQALPITEELLAIDPTNVDYWYLRGLVQNRLGEEDQALSSFKRSLRIKRDEELPRIAAEHILRQNPNTADIHQEFADYRFGRALQFRERNLLNQALNEYRRGLQINPYSVAGREGYANALLQLGLPAKYLQELKVLRSLNATGPQIDDSIETFQSILSTSVAVQWGIDQFTVNTKFISLDVAIDTVRSNLTHQESLEYIGSWIIDLLQSQEGIETSNALILSSSFSEAHLAARSNQSDYYLYIVLEDFDESILMNVDLKSSGTGTTVASYRSLYSGVDRIQRSSHYLVRQLINDIPLRSQLIKRRNNRGIINIGSAHGVQVNDTLAVVLPGALRVGVDSPSLLFQSDSVIGNVQVTRVDDLISEVNLVHNSLFDTISIGDEIIFERQSNIIPALENFPNPLYQRLRLIR